MTSSDKTPRAKRIWFDADDLWVELTDGRKVGVPLAYFPRLLQATPDQRQEFIISGGGTGLHWEEVDEDLRVAGLLADVSIQEAQAK